MIELQSRIDTHYCWLDAAVLMRAHFSWFYASREGSRCTVSNHLSLISVQMRDSTRR